MTKSNHQVGVGLTRLGCGHSCGKKATPGANGPPVQGKGCHTAARTPPGVAEAAPRRTPPPKCPKREMDISNILNDQQGRTKACWPYMELEEARTTL